MWNILFLYLSLSSDHLVYFFVNVKYFNYLIVTYRASNIFIFYNPIIFQLVLNILPLYQYLIFSCRFLFITNSFLLTFSLSLNWFHLHFCFITNLILRVFFFLITNLFLLTSFSLQPIYFHLLFFLINVLLQPTFSSK